jgi:primosomal protein N' (replication factor Y)
MNLIESDTVGTPPAKSPTLWKVAVDAPLPGLLTYELPHELVSNSQVCRGAAVLVPLGRRTVNGLLIEATKDAGEYKLKTIIDLNPGRPTLSPHFIKWLEWLSRYYVYPIGQVVSLAYPPLARSVKKRKSKRSAVVPDLPASTPPKLTEEQSTVIAGIQAFSGFQTHLVHGVTGSGKTEIYMQLLDTIVQRGQRGLVLVPEISLTPQLIDRFTRRFGSLVAVIHSHLTPREKTNQWWAAVEGDKQILIGARSALFCPIPNLGMIVIDEEHESSFKQDEKLKYHARDAAIVLAKFSDCPVVLGSATPSLESWLNAKKGRYLLHQLKARVAGRELPNIEVIDLRQEREYKKAAGADEVSPFWMSKHLHNAITETLEKGQQAALFLNRRGIAQSVICPLCGYVPACPNCAVKLTLHGKSHLLCHYCDFHETMTEHCRDCREGEPKPMGIGTEMVERDLARLYPGKRISRMDRDEISSREDLEKVIREVESREVDLLVGTQMIAKGLDFPGLTLVGLVMADVAFNLPDFRASERSFQLLTQVSGRSGRHLDSGAGRVIIQTYNPEHPSIQFTCAHDFEGFAEAELEFRKILAYPPFGRLASFKIQGIDLEKVIHTSKMLRSRASALQARSAPLAGIEILGPAQAPLARLRNNYRWQLLLKGPDAAALGGLCRSLLENQDWIPAGVKVAVDIDAVHLL